jgi:hypothetical protein
MSAKELAERLAQESQVGKEIDWLKVREEIIAEHERATTTAERITCLDLHKAIMDFVERSNCISPENMDAFRRTRAQDYRTLLVSEAIIGRTDGNVPPDKLAEITTREVNAGRLSADDEIHKLAINEIERGVSKPKIGKLRRLILLVLYAAMLLAGFYLLAIGAAGPLFKFVLGGAFLAGLGGYLLWEDFVSPVFAAKKNV